MKKRKICFISLILFLLFSGCQADTENAQFSQPVQTISTNETNQPKRYIPEYYIHLYNGTVQETFFNGSDITLLTSTGYVSLGNEKVELYQGNINNLQLEKVEFSLPMGESIQTICTVSDTKGELESLYLATGNTNVRKNKKEEAYNHLIKADKDGTILETLDISDIFVEENMPIITGMEADEEENIYFFTSTGKDITALNRQGGAPVIIEAGDIVLDMCTAHGKIYVAYFFNGVLTIGELRTSEQKLIPIFEDSEAAFGFSMTEGPQEQLLFTEGGETHAYNLRTGETTLLFKWPDYNIDSVNIANLKYLADGRILVVDTNEAGMDNAHPEYVFLREATPGEEPAAKETLTIFCSPWNRAWGLEAAINRFNKTNPDYRFEVLDYGPQFWGGLEVERLNRELITGDAPDIMIFDVANPYTMKHPNIEKPAILPYQEYGEMGVFNNLYEYMDSDPAFHREDYYENIWEAFESNGELYYFPLTFDFDTVIVNPADIGGRAKWTLDELMACVEEKGGRLDIEWQDAHGRSAKQSILELCLRTGKWELIAEGRFNDELMRKILTFSHQAGAETQIGGKVPTGSLQLKVYERSSLGNTQHEYTAFYDKWGKYPLNIGYPVKNGSGTFVRSSALAAITKDCPAPEVAWELLRTVLDDGSGGFPLRKDKFQEIWREQLKLIDITKYGSVQNGTIEFADRLEEMTEAISTISITLPIEIIIREEAEYYFQGAKPLEEVVDVIANRVTIYLEERK